MSPKLSSKGMVAMNGRRLSPGSHKGTRKFTPSCRRTHPVFRPRTARPDSRERGDHLSIRISTAFFPGRADQIMSNNVLHSDGVLKILERSLSETSTKNQSL